MNTKDTRALLQADPSKGGMVQCLDEATGRVWWRLGGVMGARRQGELEGEVKSGSPAGCRKAGIRALRVPADN